MSKIGPGKTHIYCSTGPTQFGMKGSSLALHGLDWTESGTNRSSCGMYSCLIGPNQTQMGPVYEYVHLLDWTQSYNILENPTGPSWARLGPVVG